MLRFRGVWRGRGTAETDASRHVLVRHGLSERTTFAKGRGV
jgi:hypothetical protein